MSETDEALSKIEDLSSFRDKLKLLLKEIDSILPLCLIDHFQMDDYNSICDIKSFLKKLIVITHSIEVESL